MMCAVFAQSSRWVVCKMRARREYTLTVMSAGRVVFDFAHERAG